MIKLNRWERNELIITLQNTKDSLENSDFICHRIDELAGSYNWKSWYLITWVSEMLDGHGTYESWHCYKYGKIPSKKKALKARKAWLNWMIGELKNEKI